LRAIGAGLATADAGLRATSPPEAAAGAFPAGAEAGAATGGGAFARPAKYAPAIATTATQANKTNRCVIAGYSEIAVSRRRFLPP
jgi:hypothetical protein